jgi:3-mercaptopyruvate sulfurtransferase SseA
MHHKVLVGLVLFAFVFFAGCNGDEPGSKVAQNNSNAQKAPETTYADGARRITTIELNDLIKNNAAFVVDVRNEASFNAGHIPGAKLIPAGEILNHVNELPKDKLIVTYCS